MQREDRARLAPVAVAAPHGHPKAIVPRRDAGVVRRPSRSGVDPVGVVTGELVAELQLVGPGETGRGVADLDPLAPGADGDGRAEQQLAPAGDQILDLDGGYLGRSFQLARIDQREAAGGGVPEALGGVHLGRAAPGDLHALEPVGHGEAAGGDGALPTVGGGAQLGQGDLEDSVVGRHPQRPQPVELELHRRAVRRPLDPSQVGDLVPPDARQTTPGGDPDIAGIVLGQRIDGVVGESVAGAESAAALAVDPEQAPATGADPEALRAIAHDALEVHEPLRRRHRREAALSKPRQRARAVARRLGHQEARSVADDHRELAPRVLVGLPFSVVETTKLLPSDPEALVLRLEHPQHSFAGDRAGTRDLEGPPAVVGEHRPRGVEDPQAAVLARGDAQNLVAAEAGFGADGGEGAVLVSLEPVAGADPQRTVAILGQRQHASGGDDVGRPGRRGAPTDDARQPPVVGAHPQRPVAIGEERRNVRRRSALLDVVDDEAIPVLEARQTPARSDPE